MSGVAHTAARMPALRLAAMPIPIPVPHINTPEQAAEVVRSARYYPEGRRGHDAGASRSSAYNLLEPSGDYFIRSNQEIIVAVWVEEVEGMRNLDAILQVPGVDAVHFGPGDLAFSMGHPGRADHPDVQAALAEGKRKVRAANKLLIAEPANAAAARQAIADGALLISTQVTAMLANTARDYLKDIGRT